MPLAHALTRDQTCHPGMCPTQKSTGDPPLCGTMPSQLSHAGQGTQTHFDNSDISILSTIATNRLFNTVNMAIYIMTT